MNIFFLCVDPQQCAFWHCDRHVVKMILETCQLLCTVWHVIDPEHERCVPPYRKTHVNHPCAVWARESQANYDWLFALGRALASEYCRRYGGRDGTKTHKSVAVLDELCKYDPQLPRLGLTSRPQCMPDYYRGPDAMLAYRKYYAVAKAPLHAWKHGYEPEWIAPYLRVERRMQTWRAAFRMWCIVRCWQRAVDGTLATLATPAPAAAAAEATDVPAPVRPRKRRRSA